MIFVIKGNEFMSKRPLFKLSDRLRICADFVSEGSRIADVGTDHGYLPIWLAKKNRIKHAIAADLREDPLRSAQNNINKYRVDKIVETRISDGLSNILPEEIDEIIIAGMGGELIAQIIENTSWLSENDFLNDSDQSLKVNLKKRLILQPMQTEEKLRLALFRLGFYIEKEQLVRSEGRVYTVMNVIAAQKKYEMDELYPYLGKTMENKNECAVDYIKRQIKHVKNKYDGFIACGNINEADIMLSIKEKLKSLI